MPDNSTSDMNFAYKVLRRAGGAQPSSLKFLHTPNFLSEISSKRLVYFGEIHDETRIIAMQEAVARGMKESSSTQNPTNPSTLHIVFEHFSQDMNGSVLRKWQNGSSTFEEMVKEYNKIGTEGHELSGYKGLLEMGQRKGVQLHGGFIPRPYASRLTKVKNVAEKEHLLEEVIEKGYIPGDVTVFHHGDPINRGNANGSATNGTANGTNNELNTALNTALSDLFTFHDDVGCFADFKKRKPTQNAWINTPQSDVQDLVQLIIATGGASSQMPKEVQEKQVEILRDFSRLYGTFPHFALVESMMSGRDVYDISPSDVKDPGAGDGKSGGGNNATNPVSLDRIIPPNHPIFQAQLIKDYSMGYYIAKLILQNPGDRFLVIAGKGHLQHMLGVPEIVERYLRTATEVPLVANVVDGAKIKGVLGNLGFLNSEGNTSSIMAEMMYEMELDEPEMRLDGKLLETVIGDDERVRKQMLVGGGEGLGEGGESAGSSDVQQSLTLFRHPVGDYMFVYDENDDSAGVVHQEDGSFVKLQNNEEGKLQNNEEGKACPISGETSGADKACPMGGGQATLLSSTPSNNPHAKSGSNSSEKDETREAYDRVGETAAHKGNILMAKTIMRHLGYSEEQIDIVGENDLYNYQGVGCPFLHADIKPGEKVLDLGSGLGVDAFLAVHYSTNGKASDSSSSAGGIVTGVDLSRKQVRHANERAKVRYGSNNNADSNTSAGADTSGGNADGDHIQNPSLPVSFHECDIEKLAEKSPTKQLQSSFDVAISNGAFCLIPDKKKAFEQVYKMLKPGGRMAICTSTVRKTLDNPEDAAKWPVCMRMFIGLDELAPICEEVGFKNVVVDQSRSDMELDLPDEVWEAANSGTGENKKRNKIHVGSEEFAHLQDMNMNELCAVVTVYGEK